MRYTIRSLATPCMAIVVSLLVHNVALGAAPTITGVNPAQPVAKDGKQSFVILGKDFDAKATVTLRDLDSGEPPFENRQVLSRNTTRLELSVNFTTHPARWSVQVINPGGVSSDQYRFDVVASKDQSNPSTPTASPGKDQTQPTTPQRTEIGWVYPLGQKTVVTSKCFSRGNSYVPGKVHLGTDYRAKVGQPVYAIGRGTVVHQYGNLGDSSGGGVAIVVRHNASHGTFFAIYGHVIPTVKPGDNVQAGQPLGTVSAHDGGSHLHLGIAWGTQPPRSDGANYGWGMMNEDYFKQHGVPNGLVDPETWLETQAPEHQAP